MASTPTKQHFVSGCNRAFALLPGATAEAFALDRHHLAERCQRQDLLPQVHTHREALAACRQCEHGVADAYAALGEAVQAQSQVPSADRSRHELYAQGFRLVARSQLVGVSELGYAVFSWRRAADGAALIEYVPALLTLATPRFLVGDPAAQRAVHAQIGAPDPARRAEAVPVTQGPWIEGGSGEEGEVPATLAAPAAAPAAAVASELPAFLPAPPLAPPSAFASPPPPPMADTATPSEAPVAPPVPSAAPPPPPPSAPAPAAAPSASLPMVGKPPIGQLLTMPGPSLFGSTAVRAAMQCLRRFFYERVVNLELVRDVEYFARPDDQAPKINALTLGSVVHYLLQRHYQGKPLLPEEYQPVADAYPYLMAEALRLYSNYLDKYATADAAQWDVRAVELEVRRPLPPARAGRKKVQAFLSARLDLVVREVPAGGAKLPPGEHSPEELLIVDHKTTAALREDLTDGWEHNLQALLSLSVWQGGYTLLPDGSVGSTPVVEQYGTAPRFGLTWISKAQNHNPTQHLQRPTPAQPSPTALEEFWAAVVAKIVGDVLPRLHHEKWQDESTWPKSYLCADPVTGFKCPMFRLCRAGGLAQHNPQGHYVQAERPAVTAASFTFTPAKKTRRVKAKR